MPSIMQRVGTPNPRHNLENEYRKHLENVDPELSQYNRVISRRSIEEIYAQELQPAFDEFNARQKRKDRRLDVKWGVGSALEYQRAMDVKARASKNNIDQKGKPPIREIVWQIGNPEQGFGCAGQTDESREKIFTMLQECQEEAQHRYPQFAWGDIMIHADEVSTDADDKEHGSIHLHASFVPICYQNKQGPAAQVAMERCLKEMGFESFNAWKHDLDQLMEEVLERHGLERTYMDNHEKHQDSTEWHRQQAEKRRTKEFEKQAVVAEERLNAACCMINTVVDGMGRNVDEYVEGLANEVIGDPANIYDDAMFFVQHCSDEDFEEISQQGRQLKKDILVPLITDTDAKKQSLEKMIADIAAGNVVHKEMTWEERKKRWDIYGDASKDFWAIRADLNADYQEQMGKAYQKRRDATRSYYDALYFLRRSRTLLTTIVSTVWLVTAASKKALLNNKIAELKRKRAALVHNTATFAQYSRAYRDELKAGKFPGDDYMEAMASIIRDLDKELHEHRVVGMMYHWKGLFEKAAEAADSRRSVRLTDETGRERSTAELILILAMVSMENSTGIPVQQNTTHEPRKIQKMDAAKIIQQIREKKENDEKAALREISQEFGKLEQRFLRAKAEYEADGGPESLEKLQTAEADYAVAEEAYKRCVRATEAVREEAIGLVPGEGLRPIKRPSEWHTGPDDR